MNPITMHAVGLARCGNWKLLDALEVLERARTEPTFAGMAHAPGAIALLGYIDTGRNDRNAGEMECPECDGTGEVEIIGATGRSRTTYCPWCDGDGDIDGSDSYYDSNAYVEVAQIRRWTTLNGELVEADPDGFSRSCWMSISEASQTLAEYTGLVNRLAGDAARGAE